MYRWHLAVVRDSRQPDRDTRNLHEVAVLACQMLQFQILHHGDDHRIISHETMLQPGMPASVYMFVRDGFNPYTETVG